VGRDASATPRRTSVADLQTSVTECNDEYTRSMATLCSNVCTWPKADHLGIAASRQLSGVQRSCCRRGFDDST
jgi:hypothetical protein